MNRATALGLILSAAFIAVAVFGSLPWTSSTHDQQQAADRGLMAAHSVARYDVDLARLARLGQIESLKQSDLDAVLTSAQTALDELSRESAARRREYQSLDKRSGIDGLDIEPWRASTQDLSESIQEFERQLQANRERLKDAESLAQQAQEGRGVAVAAQALGMVRCAEAAARLNEARTARLAVERQQAELLGLASAYRTLEARRKAQLAVNFGAALEQLRADAAELDEQHSTATTALQEVTGQVQQIEAELQQVQAQIQSAMQRRMDLEDRGFQAGNDADFEQYRQAYTGVSNELRDLQARHHLLQFGGYREASYAPDAFEGERQGGEPVDGLNSLTARQRALADHVSRIESAKAAIASQMEVLTSSGQSATADANQLSTRISELRQRIDGLRTQLEEAAKAAFEHEEAALQAVQRAVSAFEESSSAIRAWKSNAADIQRESDPNRGNERLKRIVDDRYAEEFSDGSKAAAQVLVGRIAAERMTGIESFLGAIDHFLQLAPGGEFDRQPLEQELARARETGTRALASAIQTYERLARATPVTGWVPQSSQAYAVYLLARLESQQRPAHVAQAAQLIQSVVDTRARSPYLAAQVAFRDHLRRMGVSMPTAATQPEEGASPSPEPE